MKNVRVCAVLCESEADKLIDSGQWLQFLYDFFYSMFLCVCLCFFFPHSNAILAACSIHNTHINEVFFLLDIFICAFIYVCARKYCYWVLNTYEFVCGGGRQPVCSIMSINTATFLLNIDDASESAMDA